MPRTWAAASTSYEQYMQYMADHGVTEEELHYMTHTIQMGLLNLTE